MIHTVVTPAATSDLTTLAAVKGDLRLLTDDAARDAWLSDRITQASEAIRDELERPIIRQRVRERFNGAGRQLAPLDVTPVAALETLENAWQGEIDLSITTLGSEYARIEDRDAGLIWVRNGFPDDAPREVWLTVDSTAESGVKPWQATYLGGWLTRAEDIMASGVTASGTDLILEAGGVMPLVAPGDQIRLSGWVQNRGRHVVASRPDDLTIRVETALAFEIGGAASVIEVRNLPAKLERACIETVRDWYYKRTQNSTLKSESIGDWSASYGGPDGDGSMASTLSASVLKTLDQYRRLM